MKGVISGLLKGEPVSGENVGLSEMPSKVLLYAKVVFDMGVWVGYVQGD